MTPGRLARGGRAALFAAVCVLLAATGHVLMSGCPVAGWALCAAFAVTVAAAWGPAARERGLLAVTAGAVAAQTVLHSVFSWAQSGGVAAPGTAGTAGGAMGAATMYGSPMYGSPMYGSPMSHVPMAAPPMSHVPMAAPPMSGVTPVDSPMVHLATGQVLYALSASFGMVAAHLLAALLSGLWLAYGERAVFGLLWALPAGLFRPFGLLLGRLPAPDDRPRLRPVLPGDERAPRRLHLACSLLSRAPPRVAAVV